MSKSRVVAAIPNYNMSKSLKMLLGQLVEEKYDQIYVLDDASTDDSVDVASKFKDVTVIKGEKNIGASGNRNRILSEVTPQTIIHFLDADTTLETKNVVNKVRQMVAEYPNRVIGGMILTKSGAWHEFNYGPKGDFRSFIGARVHLLSVMLFRRGNEKTARRIRKVFNYFVSDWPDVLQPPQATEAFWVTEGNLIIPGSIFIKTKGFNSSLREHEILEYGYRLHKAHIPVIFDPSIKVTHKEINVRPRFRRVYRSFYHLKVIFIRK